MADLARGDTYPTVQQRYGITRNTVRRIHRQPTPTSNGPMIPVSAFANMEGTHAADAEARERAEAELERMRQGEAEAGDRQTEGTPQESPPEPPKKSAREITAESLYATINNAQLREILTATAKIGAGNVAQCLDAGAQLIYDYWPVARLQGYEEGQTRQFLADLFNFWVRWKDKIAEYEEEKVIIEAYERMRAYVVISRMRGRDPDMAVVLAALASPQINIIELIP